MADLTINPKTIVVKTAAQWAADTTVYNERQRLVTSNAFWGATNQRKEKIADGVKTWSQLDYPPFITSVTTPSWADTMAIDNKSGEDIVLSDDKVFTDELGNNFIDLGNGLFFKLGGNNGDFLYSDADETTLSNGSGGVISITDLAMAGSFYYHQKITGSEHRLKGLLIKLDASDIELTQESANRFVSTDGSKMIETPWSRTTNTGLSGNSDTNIPTEKAVKAYVDSTVSAATVGLLDDRGNFDASVNLFPSSGGSGTVGAILKGDLWTISVAGTLGGSAVTAGDVVRALVDTPGQTSSNWAIGETNIGYAAENQTNKTDTVASNESSSTKYLSVKGYYDYLIGLVWLTAARFGDWIVALTGKTTPVDADSIVISDSAASDDAKKVSLTNLWTNYFKPKADALYPTGSGSSTGTNTGDNSANSLYASLLNAPKTAIVITNVITHTGGVNGAETIVFNTSLNFTGRISAGDLLMMLLGVQGSNTGNNKTINIYFSDSATSLSNQVLVGSYVFTTAVVNTSEMTKVMAMKTISTQNVISGTAIGVATGATMGTTAIDFTSVAKYIVITITLAVNTDTVKLQFGRFIINSPW